MTTEQEEFFNDLGHHDDYAGMFSRGQAEGAIPNGTRIIKRNSEEGDSTPDGTGGVILGSINGVKAGVPAAIANGVTYLYFVEWDDKPKVAIGTVDKKVEAV